MRDGRGIVDTCKELAERGADVTGMNCFRGPNTMMPHIRKIRAAVPGHIAALPITFRTTEEEQTFFSLKMKTRTVLARPRTVGLFRPRLIPNM